MIFDVANVAVAIIAILVSAAFSGVAYRAAVHQNRLSASSVAADWLRDLRSWAFEVIDVLSEASYVAQKGGLEETSEVSACLHRSRHRLSALVDRGRFLLPNERSQEYGDYKPNAYRGLRHHALDSLVAAESILGDDLPLLAFPDKKHALVGLRREFVSAIHAIIDPQSTNRKIAAMLRIADEGRVKDPTLGGLLPDASKIPTGAQGILETASLRYDRAEKEAKIERSRR